MQICGGYEKRKILPTQKKSVHMQIRGWSKIEESATTVASVISTDY